MKNCGKKSHDLGAKDFGSNVVGSTKDVVDKLDTYVESGFTKKSTRANRDKNDAFGKIGL